MAIQGLWSAQPEGDVAVAPDLDIVDRAALGAISRSHNQPQSRDSRIQNIGYPESLNLYGLLKGLEKIADRSKTGAWNERANNSGSIVLLDTNLT
jgi:hypothetical protein